jgi:hypothetical protein
LLGAIADLVGVEIAFEIARAHGGVRVSIPPRAEPDHWLTAIVGLETADRICRGLATMDADGNLKGVSREILPRGPAAVLRSARRRAQQALDDGLSARQAALVSGLHERTIWRMKADGDDEQGSLF